MNHNLIGHGEKSINAQRILGVVKKRCNIILVGLLLIWGSVALTYFTIPREYVATYGVQLAGVNPPEVIRPLLDSDDAKNTAIAKVGFQNDVGWYAKRISVVTVKNARTFQVSVKAKSPEEAVVLAQAVLCEQKRVLDAFNQVNLSNIKKLQGELQRARAVAVEATEGEKELALIEYKALVTAYCSEYMKSNVQLSSAIIELSKPVSQGNVVFPNPVAFIMAGVAMSTIFLALIIAFFY